MPGIVEVIKHVTVIRDAWAEMLTQGGGTVNTALINSSATNTPGQPARSP